MLYQRLISPLLFCLDAETIHELTVSGLLRHLPWLIPANEHNRDSRLSVELAGIHFPNRIGLAAGMDKNALAINAWENIGFGFVEVGTITYHPQAGNPKPRLFRLKEQKSLLNRMGFNNDGAQVIANRLAKLKTKTPIGINLGKSKIVDPNDQEAVIADYLSSLRLLQDHGDYITINVSSPNTPNLREWEKPEKLSQLLKPIKAECKKPLFVKISADQPISALDQIIELSLDIKLAGIIATNTTISRDKAPRWTHNEAGGISGALVKEKSREITAYLGKHKPKELALISVGGIDSYDEMKARLDLGADLVQIYTSLIYQGPGLINELNARSLSLLDQ